MGTELSRDGNLSAQATGKGHCVCIQSSRGFWKRTPTDLWFKPLLRTGSSLVLAQASPGFVQPSPESQGAEPREGSCFLSDILIEKIPLV